MYNMEPRGRSTPEIVHSRAQRDQAAQPVSRIAARVGGAILVVAMGLLCWTLVERQGQGARCVLDDASCAQASWSPALMTAIAGGLVLALAPLLPRLLRRTHVEEQTVARRS